MYRSKAGTKISKLVYIFSLISFSCDYNIQSLLKCNKTLKIITFMEFANRAINVIVYAILLCSDADTNIKFIFVYSFIAGSRIYPEETYSQK